jgi:hypothetical protein
VSKGKFELVGLTTVPIMRDIEIIGGYSSENCKFVVVEDYIEYSKY